MTPAQTEIIELYKELIKIQTRKPILYSILEFISRGGKSFHRLTYDDLSDLMRIHQNEIADLILSGALDEFTIDNKTGYCYIQLLSIMSYSGSVAERHNIIIAPVLKTLKENYNAAPAHIQDGLDMVFSVYRWADR